MDCKEADRIGVPHEGHEPCTSTGCDREWRWCVYVGDSPTSPHACRCEIDEDHGYFCGYHQLDHADEHGVTRSAAFPYCGGLAAAAALESVIRVQAMSFSSAPWETDRELVAVLTEAPDTFLNLSAPGTERLNDALAKLATRGDRAVEPGEIAQPTEWWGQRRLPFLRFSPDFWTGGTLDRVARVALEHLEVAALAGFSHPVSGEFAKSQEVLENLVKETLLSSTSLRPYVSARPGQEERLFDLLYELRDSIPRVQLWLQRVAGTPLPDLERLALSLILDLEWELA